MEQLTLFAEDSPARTSALPAKWLGCSRGSGRHCGSTCCESCERFDPLLYLLKTSVELSIWRLTTLFPGFETRSTKSGRSSYLLLRLEPRTDGSAYLSSESGKMWPTPAVSDFNGAEGSESLLKRGRSPLTNNLRDSVKAVCGLPLQSAGTITGAEAEKAETVCPQR